MSAQVSPYDDEFQLDPSIIYLNHAAVSPWPKRTERAVAVFAAENGQFGAKNYPNWMKKEAELKQLLASLINALSPDEISLVKNTSEGLSIVAQGLSWQPGDNIVIPAEEFPSNRIVWEALAPQGVEIRKVHFPHHANPEQLLINACDKRTRLLSVSAVQYATGLRLNLPQLGEYCDAADIYFCIDGIQAIGAMQFDVRAYQADFVMADGHKWMLGPEGLALFYCRAEIRDQLTLRQHGWHMLAHPSDFMSEQWQAADSGRRFEPGSPNMVAIHALAASVALLLEIGMPRIEQAVLAQIDYCAELMAARSQLECLSDLRPGRYAGIVTFRHRSQANEDIFTRLMENGVVCALRGGGIRFSPHYYLRPAQLFAAMAIAAA
jgi:selenocysteine lyase/cysteine desulfurase